jgi:hypothetical protein
LLGEFLMKSASGFLCLSGNEEQKDVDAQASWRTVLHAPSATFIHGLAGGGMEVNIPLVNEVGIGENARTTRRRNAICEGGHMRSVWFAGGSEFHARFGWDGYLTEPHGEAIRVAVCGQRMTIQPLAQSPCKPA